MLIYFAGITGFPQRERKVQEAGGTRRLVSFYWRKEIATVRQVQDERREKATHCDKETRQ